VSISNLHLNSIFGINCVVHINLALSSIWVTLMSTPSMTWWLSITYVIWAINIASGVFTSYITPVVLDYWNHHLHKTTSFTRSSGLLVRWGSFIIHFKCCLLLMRFRALHYLIQIAIEVKLSQFVNFALGCSCFILFYMHLFPYLWAILLQFQLFCKKLRTIMFFTEMIRVIRGWIFLGSRLLL
jgi:hypothetical protein